MKRPTIAESIIKGLQRQERVLKDDNTFGVEQLTRFIRMYRGKWVMDGTVTRELRRFNESTTYCGYVLKWEVVKGGVYKITAFHSVEDLF